MPTGTIVTKISDERLKEVRAMIGAPRRRTYQEWELDDARILRSSIRSYAVILGDMRPLFVDADYAAASPWKSLIVPPSILAGYEQFDPEIESFPGSQAILATATLEWNAPVRVGDVIIPESVIKSVEDLSGPAGSGRVVSMDIATTARTNEGKLTGSTLFRWHCVERGTAAQRALFGGREEPHMYSKADIDALGAEYKEERAQGATPLYWEDVTAGQELQHVLKGPTTRNKYLGRAVGNWYWGHAQGFEAWEKRPELFFTNENEAPEPIPSTDWGHHRAQRWGGVPGALESNTERIHYFSHLIMNWMGDHGFLRRMNLEFVVQNMVGDVTRSYGRVSGKRQDSDGAVVSLDVWQINQIGEQVTKGSVEVLLPTRAGAPAIAE